MSQPTAAECESAGNQGSAQPHYPAAIPSESKQLCAVALRAVLIVSSSGWAEALIGADSRAEEFSCVTQVLWQASMAAFESAVNTIEVDRAAA